MQVGRSAHVNTALPDSYRWLYFRIVTVAVPGRA